MAAVWAALALSWAQRAAPASGQPKTRWPAMLSSQLDGEQAPAGGNGSAEVVAPGTTPHPALVSYLSTPSTRGRVHKWLRRLGIPGHELDDLTEDVLLEGLESANRYDPRAGKPARWLNRITVYVAGHFHERSARRCEELVSEPPERQDPAPSVEKAFAREELRMTILARLLELPSDQAAIVTARDIDGMPMKKAAENLGVPLSTAYKRRAKGLSALAELLRPLCSR
jgi:RNA polymerase sigma-70 factor (ECF subfamily)